MARVPLPDLDTDERITRSDYSGSSHRNLLLAHVVITYIRLRMPDSVGTMVKDHFEEEISGRTIRNYVGQRIAVVLEDYGERLMAEPQYQTIKDLFLRSINIHGLMGYQEERRFQNLLSKCFVSKLTGNQKPHDDWTMMAIAITAELAIEILLSSGNAADAYKLVIWMEAAVRSLDKEVFAVSKWLFLRWLQKYSILKDPSRACNLIKDPTILLLTPAQINQLIDVPLKAQVGRGAIFRSSQLGTVICPNEAPPDIYGSANLEERPPTRKETKYVIKEIILSYVLSRIRPTAGRPDIREMLSRRFAQGRCTDFSRRPLGRAMTEYGNTISRTELYKKLLNFIKAKDNLSQLTYINFIVNHIFPRNGNILYDHIMTVCVLTSDLINALPVEALEQRSKVIIEGASNAFEYTENISDIVQKGLFRLAHYYPEIKRRGKFDLLDNHSLVGGQRPASSAAPGPSQTLPLICAGDNPITMRPADEGKGTVAKAASSTAPSTSSSQPYPSVKLLGPTKLVISLSTSGNKRVAASATLSTSQGKTTALIGLSQTSAVAPPKIQKTKQNQPSGSSGRGGTAVALAGLDQPTGAEEQYPAERRAAEEQAPTQRRAAEEQVRAQRRVAEEQAQAERRVAEEQARAERRAAEASSNTSDTSDTSDTSFATADDTEFLRYFGAE